jgi:hypothetical protein
MSTVKSVEKAADVKARQQIVPRWMQVIPDDQIVVVMTQVTPFGRFVVDMREADVEELIEAGVH